MSTGVGAQAEGDRVVATALEAMAILDERRHRTVNERYASLFGYDDARDLEGEPWERLYVGPTGDGPGGEILTACRGEGRWQGAVRGRRRDGSTVALVLSAAGLDDGRVLCSVRTADEGGAGGPVGHPVQRDQDGPRSVDAVVVAAVAAVPDATSCGELEDEVCSTLASSDRYVFTWIGGPSPTGEQVVPRTVAGIDGAALESRHTRTNGSPDDGRRAAGRALRTGEVTVERDAGPAPPAGRRGPVPTDQVIGSIAAIPVTRSGASEDVLVIGASRRVAFDRRERGRLRTLGRVLGSAMDAVQDRRLLHADRIVELEFEVVDDDLAFVRVTDRLGCELTISGCVATASGRWSVYLTVDGADPDAVRQVALKSPDVESVQVIASADRGGELEFVMGCPALAELAASGATLAAGHVGDGQGRFCLEVPGGADVRRLADRLRATYPDSTLVAQRESDRPARTAAEVRTCVASRLTDRQREALERATHAGYFAWPRTSTAGDVAASMDVSETTFHYHLRNGLDTLLDAFVDPLER